jgi:hypothetical protein
MRHPPAADLDLFRSAVLLLLVAFNVASDAAQQNTRSRAARSGELMSQSEVLKRVGQPPPPPPPAPPAFSAGAPTSEPGGGLGGPVGSRVVRGVPVAVVPPEPPFPQPIRRVQMTIVAVNASRVRIIKSSLSESCRPLAASCRMIRLNGRARDGRSRTEAI